MTVKSFCHFDQREKYSDIIALDFDYSIMPRDHTYYVYIVVNPDRSTVYIGMTKNLTRRLKKHKGNRGINTSFAERYYCYEFVYYEIHKYVNNAIVREKELKKWSRAKKNALIESFNPSWDSLNIRFYEQ